MVRRDVSSNSGDTWWQSAEPVEEKRHLGAAMNMRPGQMGWAQHESVPDNFYRQVRYQGDNFQYDLNDLEPEFDLDKRHLGSALNMRFGGWRYRQGESKRHLGAALKFRQPRFDEWQLLRMGHWHPPPSYKETRNSVLGSLYRSYANQFRQNYKNRKSHQRAKRDVEQSDVSQAIMSDDDKSEDKRHLGAALYPGRRPWSLSSPSNHHGMDKRDTSGEEDTEVEGLEQVPDKKSQNDDVGQELAELPQDEDFEKRHFGAALNLVRGRPKWKTDEYWRGDDKDKRDGSERVDKDGEITYDGVEKTDDKRHLGPAMKFRPAMITKQEPEQTKDKKDALDENDGDLLDASNDAEKRHIGAARNMAALDKRHFGAARNVGHWTSTIKQGKRHLGAAMNMVPAKHNDDKDKRHMGAALAFGKADKRHLGSALQFGQWSKPSDKRHMGAALAIGKRDDENDDEKRHLGSAMKFRQLNNENDKRHMGAAIAAKEILKLMKKKGTLVQL